MNRKGTQDGGWQRMDCTGPRVNHTQEHQNQAVTAYQQIHRYVNILKTRYMLAEYEVWSLV